jgi:hypothetical protein
MRHMDDGLLQSWLDHPRSGLEPAEHSAIEAHLAECAACRERLELLRSGDDALAELLSAVTGGEEEIPDFDTVVERAAKLGGPGGGSSAPVPHGSGTPTRAGRRPLVAMGWAASVVVALGAGWLWNEMSRAGRPGAQADRVALQSGPAQRLPEVVAETDAPAGVGAVSESATGAEPEATRLRADRAPDAPAPETLEQLPAVASAEVGGTLGDTTAGDPTGGNAAAVDMAFADAAPAARRAVPSQLAEVARPDADWRAVTLEEAGRAVGFEVATIPGLQVTSVEVGELAGVPTVRLRQELGDGRVLTLLQAARPLVSVESQGEVVESRTLEGGIFVAARLAGMTDELGALLDRLPLAPR